MEKYYKINSIMIFLNMIVFGYISIDLCITSFVIKDGNLSAWFIYLIYIIPITILFLINKKVPNYIHTNKFLKILLLLYTSIQIGCIFYYGSLIFAVWFYPQTEQYIFIFISLILIIYLSLKQDYVLFSVGFAFVVVSFIFTIINLSINTPHNFQLLLPITKPTNLFKMFYIVTFPLENILYLFFNESFKKPISKKLLIFSTFLTLIFSTISIIDSYTIVTYQFYIDLPLPNINRYFLSNGDKIFQHLDIILFFYAFIVTIYKGAFYFKLNYKINPKINKVIIIIVSSLLAIATSITIIFFSTSIKIFLFTSSILIILLTILLLFKKENKHVNKHH